MIKFKDSQDLLIDAFRVERIQDEDGKAVRFIWSNLRTPLKLTVHGKTDEEIKRKVKLFAEQFDEDAFVEQFADPFDPDAPDLAELYANAEIVKHRLSFLASSL